ncbi:hypothetical protein [Microbacterium sp.]|uniref:hypothetical protein n=1 Tax=Microbacterium sp. TaxID=51671 RepID=UPI003A8BCC76
MILELIGWLGSALVIVSLLQSNPRRFRTLNLYAAAVLTGYNAAVAVWPMVALNAVIVAINVVFLVRMRAAPRPETGGLGEA